MDGLEMDRVQRFWIFVIHYANGFRQKHGQNPRNTFRDGPFPIQSFGPIDCHGCFGHSSIIWRTPHLFSIRKAQISGEFPLPGASSGALGVEGCDQGEGGTLAIWCTRSEVSQGHAMRPFIDGVSPCRAVGDILTVVI